MSIMATMNKNIQKDAKDLSKTDKKGSAAQAGEAVDLATYFKGVRSEWGKITWPTWPQIWGQTIVVLVMVAIMTTGLWLIDTVFRLLINWVTPH